MNRLLKDDFEALISLVFSEVCLFQSCKNLLYVNCSMSTDQLFWNRGHRFLIVLLICLMGGGGEWWRWGTHFTLSTFIYVARFACYYYVCHKFPKLMKNFYPLFFLVPEELITWYRKMWMLIMTALFLFYFKHPLDQGTPPTQC